MNPEAHKVTSEIRHRHANHLPLYAHYIKKKRAGASCNRHPCFRRLETGAQRRRHRVWRDSEI